MHNNISSTGRLAEFDAAKGIAILCVILGHLGIYNINRVVYTFHMPIFFLISGYFLSFKYSYSDFIHRKFSGIIQPYIATCILICILSIPISFVQDQSIVTNLVKWICGSIYGSGFPDSPVIIKHFPSFIGALWFLPSLFWGSLIARYILDHNDDLKSFAILCILFYVGWKTAETIWLPFDIQAGLTASLYLFWGYISKKYSILKTHISYFTWFVILFIAAWAIKYFKGLWFVKNYFGNGIFDILASLAISFIIMKICAFIVDKLPHLTLILQWFGKNSIIVLAFHIIELDLFPWQLLIDRFGIFGQDLNHLSGLGLTIIIIMKLLWVILGISFINHIPFMKRIYKA